MALHAQAPQASQLKDAVLQALDAHKAFDITTIDLTGKSSIADAMIIASGTSSRHVATLAGYVEEACKAAGLPQVSTEGKDQGDWVLIDGLDVIVHIFRPEVRAIYNLEKMWNVPAIPDLEYA